MPATEPRTGRFRAKYDPLTLVHSVVPDIARTAAGADADPRTVSQRAYDRARARSRFPDAPGADATSRRLGLPWPELLHTVLAPGRSASQTLGAAGRRDGRAAIPVVEAVAGIRLIAQALEPEADLDPATYDRLREELVENDEQAWLHGGDPNELLAPQPAALLPPRQRPGARHVPAPP